MTYLGVILDQKLNWSLHIDNKVAKAKKFLHQTSIASYLGSES